MEWKGRGGRALAIENEDDDEDEYDWGCAAQDGLA